MPDTKLLPEPLGRYQTLEVLGVLPQGVGFDFVVFNTDRGPSRFALLNTTILNHRARAMLIQASHGRIEANHIENSTLGGIVVAPELYWGEGDYVTNVTITRNLIRSVCIGKQCYGGLALGGK